MSNKLSRQEVYALIDGERNYQDSRWNPATTASNGNHSPAEWVLYIEDYLAEARKIASREADPVSSEKVMVILRKVGAMAVAAMEQNGAQPR